MSGLSIGRIDRRHRSIALGRAGDWRQASTRARGAISGENDVKRGRLPSNERAKAKQVQGRAEPHLRIRFNSSCNRL
eukprot:scaffold130912_cov81-Phaeocystis_antarctica.AAC.2